MIVPMNARTLIQAIGYGSWVRFLYNGQPLLAEPIELHPDDQGSYTVLLAKRVNEEDGSTSQKEESFEFHKIEAVVAIEPPPLKRRPGVTHYNDWSVAIAAEKARF